MVAPMSERLFSLELLADWVRLEARLLPWQPVAEAEEGSEEEEASPPWPSRSLCPAVAFRLLDFPTLLVYPPGRPGAPAGQPRPGLVSFGRGKSCLFRMQPATLRRRLLAAPLYTMLLQLSCGRSTPTPRLLGTGSISLATAARKVLGPAAAGCSHGYRGRFPLYNHVGEQIGDISLGYRLTDLGSSLLGHLERPVTSAGAGAEGAGMREAVEVSSQSQHEEQLQPPDIDPSPGDADRSQESLKHPETQKDLKEIVSPSKASSDNTGSVENGKTSYVCSNAGGVGSASLPNQEVTELDIETNNIFCPPPLYYTHITQEKRPPQQWNITIKPQMNVSEELDSTFSEEKLVHPPTHTNLKHLHTAEHESPAAVLNPPHVQDVGASNKSTCLPQSEQNTVNTIQQLPLLNALLVELSLLYNQPVASPTYIHPHLAWLCRTEDKKSRQSSAKSTSKSESKKGQLSLGGNEKPVSLQYKKNQGESLKKGKYFEKNNGMPPKRVPKGKLLYGLTNTLKLRLKQTNPDVLVVHEKREQYRMMQAQMLGAKLRIPSSQVKIFSFAEQYQKPHQRPEAKCLESDTNAENSGTSKLISGVIDDPSTTKEPKLKHATEKTVDPGENKINNGLLEEIVSPANSILERFAHTNTLEEKVEMRVQSPFAFQKVAAVNKILIDKERDDKQVKTIENDILTADLSENKPSKNSCSESISELKYSDDFTSPCYSEDFYTTENIRILQAYDGSPGAENLKHSQYASKSSEIRLPIRKNSSEKSFILSPPFSAGSPIYSCRRSHISKTQDKSLEEAFTISTSDLSSYWTEEKENQMDQNSVHNSKVKKRGQDISIKLKSRTDCMSLEKSQSVRTSQVSSYLPSNLSECSKSDHFEEDSSEVDSLNISKQCKDICELVVNKLPGYTV
ncbi:microtubule-associated protein 10 [Saccopteryx leptura]|uniref:microtubule-associated protein 10 n=1 Tax=Saccopteryx leptura TaxID=249018 RepID=UPI00339D1A60